MTPVEIAKRIIEEADKVGFKAPHGHTQAMTGSCYVELAYRAGRFWGSVEVRISDHAPSESAFLAAAQRGCHFIDVKRDDLASKMAAVMRDLGDTRAVVDARAGAG